MKTGGAIRPFRFASEDGAAMVLMQRSMFSGVRGDFSIQSRQQKT